MAEKYILRVTAGPTYDLADHTEVPVNAPTPVSISSARMDIELNVRIQNYRGLPPNSPSTSPYFSQEPHATNKDQYSIAFRFTPKNPEKTDKTDKKEKTNKPPAATDAQEDDAPAPAADGISAFDLQFGNDFDHPIRDRLPPGFSYAMKIVKWWIDPGLDGDPYADSPYLFGPALSSFNAIHVGRGALDDAKGGLCFDEGASDDEGDSGDGDGDGGDSRAWREDVGAPADGKARMKWALHDQSKHDWVWEYGRTYAVDFFNAYLDFSEFALRLPGYAVPIMKYWDGQGLR